MTGPKLVEDSVQFRADATKSDTAGGNLAADKKQTNHVLASHPSAGSNVVNPRLRIPDSA